MEEQLQRQNSLLKSLLDKLQRKIALDRRRLVWIRDERDQAVYREVRLGKRYLLAIICHASHRPERDCSAEPDKVASRGQAAPPHTGAR